MFGIPSTKIKLRNLIILISFITVFVSCKKNLSFETDSEKSLTANDITDSKLLAAAKQFYLEQKNLPLSDNSKAQRPIDFLLPDWQSVKFTRNSLGEKVIGVPLTSADFEYNEMNVLVKGGVTYGIIKRYNHRSAEESDLTIVSSNGSVIGKAVYFRKNHSAKIDIKYRSSNQKYSPLFIKMEETVNGGELEEVIITPGGGGGSTNPPIVFPPTPVVPNPPPAGGEGSGYGAVATEPDSEDGDGGWNDYIPQEIAKQTMPNYQDFVNAYPDLVADAVYDLIGGDLLAAKLADPNQWRNACAIRVSRALNYSGKPIPEIPGLTKKGADGKNYIFRGGLLMSTWQELLILQLQ